MNAFEDIIRRYLELKGYGISTVDLKQMIFAEAVVSRLLNMVGRRTRLNQLPKAYFLE